MQYVMIPFSEYDAFCRSNESFKCRVAAKYTDGTAKIILEEIVAEEIEESWEEKREFYLRCAGSDAKKAAEGFNNGFISDDESSLMGLCIVSKGSIYWDEPEHYAETLDEWFYDSPYSELEDLAGRNWQRKKLRSVKRLYKDDFTAKIRRWEKEYWNGSDEETMFGEHTTNSLLRRLSRAGFFYMTQSLSEEDKIDYIGHGFGLLAVLNSEK